MGCQLIKMMALALGFLVFLIACSSYNVKESPVTTPETMPYTQTEAMVEVGVDPYVQPDKAKALFGEDLLAADIIPLQVVIRNLGERQVRIEAKNFRLGLPGGEVVAPRPGSEVAALFNARSGIFDYASTGIGLLGRLGGVIGGLAATIIGGVVSGSLKGSQRDVSLERQQDYARKELKDVTLGKNESSRGFLFFSPSAGTMAFDEATLILDIYDMDATIVNIKTVIKDLGYKSKPTAEK